MLALLCSSSTISSASSAARPVKSPGGDGSWWREGRREGNEGCITTCSACAILISFSTCPPAIYVASCAGACAASSECGSSWDMARRLCCMLPALRLKAHVAVDHLDISNLADLGVIHYLSDERACSRLLAGFVHEAVQFLGEGRLALEPLVKYFG